MRTLLKRAAYAVAPDTALRLLSIRSRRMIERQCRELGLDKLSRRAAERSGNRVASGPFEGMRLNYNALPVHSAPKFVGSYEQELHEAVEREIARNPPTVLNVGCAEGYYAAGFAIRLPEAHVYFADADPKAVWATIINGTINGAIDRMTPIGIIHPGEFGQYLRDGSLVVMDCEGAEFDLLNTTTDPILLRCDHIVEVHPKFGDPNRIVWKFADTHEIERVEPQPRTTPESDERTDDKLWLVMARRR